MNPFDDSLPLNWTPTEPLFAGRVPLDVGLFVDVRERTAFVAVSGFDVSLRRLIRNIDHAQLIGARTYQSDVIRKPFLAVVVEGHASRDDSDVAVLSIGVSPPKDADAGMVAAQQLLLSADPVFKIAYDDSDIGLGHIAGLGDVAVDGFRPRILRLNLQAFVGKCPCRSRRCLRSKNRSRSGWQKAPLR